ncbi:MAG: hypothetical protein F6J93_07860 [Oscillatoria sp. SIO1A7]|nr:hypothetical protein [Oscillatoria sp. SIO1A7]
MLFPDRCRGLESPTGTEVSGLRELTIPLLSRARGVKEYPTPHTLGIGYRALLLPLYAASRAYKIYKICAIALF